MNDRAPREHVLVNLGTPASPTAEGVRAFLGEFLADPMVVELPRILWLPILRGIVLRKRPARVAELYRSIWTERGSPLAVSTADLAAALDARVGAATRVSVAYRYGEPSLRARIEAALERAEQVLVTPLFPQRTASSTGTIQRVVETLPAAQRARVRYAAIAPDAPGYIEALNDRLEQALADGPPPERVMCSFHGIPQSVDRREGATYSGDCARTVEALLERAGIERERGMLCYQSRFGPTKWLTPPTEETLVELARQGLRRVAVLTPGFITEGLETLEEIGVRAREAFLEAGGEELVRVPCATTHPGVVEDLARLWDEPP